MKTLKANTKLLCVNGHTVGYTAVDIKADGMPVCREWFRFVPDDTVARGHGARPPMCPECGETWGRHYYTDPGRQLRADVLTEYGWWPHSDEREGA